MNRVLAESAPLARQWAKQSCWRNPADDESCAWYHGGWQMLRLLGVVSTLTHHAPLFIEALRPLIKAGNFRRIMLCGSADYGLLSVILDAFAEAEVNPDITVIDRCRTPLLLCQWYAERYGYSIRTVESDLVAFRDQVPCDLICAHSLLSCIPVISHKGVVETWHSLLRPGGIVMFANTIYPEIAKSKTYFNAEDIAHFRRRVAAAVEGCSHPQALPSEREIDSTAEAFARGMEASVISSRRQLTDLLTEGGFELLESRFGDLIKAPGHERTGPPRIKSKEYAWIVARRP